MDRDDIIRMARAAGLCDEEGRDSDSIVITSYLEHFAKLVAAAEREECAKVCDRWVINRYDTNLLSAAIRARGSNG
jgi:hypothetical protein